MELDAREVSGGEEDDLEGLLAQRQFACRGTRMAISVGADVHSSTNQ